MNNYALTVENLCKSYGKNQVLKNISFEVKQGEIFALLGMNGAGKTTTLECIEGLRKYTKGNITIKGKIGVQLQSSSLPNHITAKEAVTLFLKWSGKTITAEQQDFICGFENNQYKRLSTGQKRRLHLALALTCDPNIIILDEPTAGLDVEGRLALHDAILSLQKSGKTLIIASHDMAEVEALCNRLIIIKEGECVFTGSVLELTGQAYTGEVVIKIKTSALLSSNSLLKCRYLNNNYGGYTEYCANSIEDGVLELISLATSTGVKVYDLRIENTGLERRFLEVYKESAI